MRRRVVSLLNALVASKVPALAFAYGTTALATFALSVTLGRTSGAEALGSFALAVSVARIFYAGTEFGIAAHLTRQTAKDPSDHGAAELFLTFRGVLIPAAVAVGVAAALLFGDRELLAFCFVAIALGISTLQNVYESLMLGKQLPNAVAALTITTSACVALGCLVSVVTGTDVARFAFTYAAANALGLAIWMRWSARNIDFRPRMAPNTARLKHELRSSWPIGVSNLLAIAALKSPVLVLGAFTTAEDIGVFSAIDVFITATTIVQIAVTSATFPKLAASYGTDPGKFRRMFWSSNVALAGAGLLVGGVLVAFGGVIVPMIFAGKAFTRIAPLMPIVGWSTPALLLVHHNILVFAAGNRERMNVLLMAAWTALIVILQLALVPSWGVTGAIWALLIGRVFGLVIVAAAIRWTSLHRGIKRQS